MDLSKKVEPSGPFFMAIRIKSGVHVLGPELMFAKRDNKHYPSRSRQTSLVTAVTNITKHVTKIDFGPSTDIR